MAASKPNSTYMTVGDSSQPTDGTDSNASAAVKPTLLSFHGSGSNSMIHTVQLARLMNAGKLKEYFDVESLEAPFPSAAGPGVLPFFEGCGPFKRWIPPSEKISLDGMKRGEASSAMPPEVESLIKAAVKNARARGSRVVGLIGFSQGTRVVAGLLKGVEMRAAIRANGGTCGGVPGGGGGGGGGGAGGVDEDARGNLDWLEGIAFAISVCGSYPPPLIPQAASAAVAMSKEMEPEEKRHVIGQRIRLPTLHVNGKEDEWGWAAKLLIQGCYEVGEGKSEVLECNMGHVYPVVTEESEMVGRWALEQWRRAGGGGQVRR